MEILVRRHIGTGTVSSGTHSTQHIWWTLEWGISPSCFRPHYEIHVLTIGSSLCGLQVLSLNRHAVATQLDVGMSKAAVLEKHFAEIVPKVWASSSCSVHP